MEIEALVNSKSIKDEGEWNREYDRYSADDKAFREDFKKKFGQDATDAPYGFEKGAVEDATMQADGESTGIEEETPSAVQVDEKGDVIEPVQVDEKGDVIESEPPVEQVVAPSEPAASEEVVLPTQPTGQADAGTT